MGRSHCPGAPGSESHSTRMSLPRTRAGRSTSTCSVSGGTCADVSGSACEPAARGSPRARDPLALTEAEYDELFDVNVRAAYFCSQQAIPHLEKRRGSIVSVSSIHGGGGFRGHTAYAATKGALNAFTRALAMDLAPKRIRV